MADAQRAAAWRMQVLARHLGAQAGPQEEPQPQLVPLPVAGSIYASATGVPSSYEKVRSRAAPTAAAVFQHEASLERAPSG